MIRPLKSKTKILLVIKIKILRKIHHKFRLIKQVLKKKRKNKILAQL